MQFELALNGTAIQVGVFEGNAHSLRQHVRKHVLDEKERWAKMLGLDKVELDHLLDRLKRLQPNCDGHACCVCGQFSRCTPLVEEVERLYQRRLQAAIMRATEIPRYADHYADHEDEPARRDLYFVDERGVLVICEAGSRKPSKSNPPGRLRVRTGYRPIRSYNPPQTDAEFLVLAKRKVREWVGPVTRPPYYIPETWAVIGAGR